MGGHPIQSWTGWVPHPVLDRDVPVADLREGAPGMHRPMDQNFFNFMGFFRKCINILGRLPPKGVDAPPMTSSGSTPGYPPPHHPHLGWGYPQSAGWGTPSRPGMRYPQHPDLGWDTPTPSSLGRGTPTSPQA